MQRYLLPVKTDGCRSEPAQRFHHGPDGPSEHHGANNEIGVLQPMEESARFCRERGVRSTLMRTSLGKTPLTWAG